MSVYDSPEWHAFIAGIRERPDDDVRRLVAADYLEERGEGERAGFVRAQVVRRHGWRRPKVGQMRRWFGLWWGGKVATNPHGWTAGGANLLMVRPRGEADPLTLLDVHRGFVRRVQAPLSDLLAHLPALVRREPLLWTGVQITDRKPDATGSGRIVWQREQLTGAVFDAITCNDTEGTWGWQPPGPYPCWKSFPTRDAAISALHAAVWSVSGGGSATGHAPSPATATA